MVLEDYSPVPLGYIIIKAQGEGVRCIVGSVVECSPATWAAQAHFLDNAPIVNGWLSYGKTFMVPQVILT